MVAQLTSSWCLWEHRENSQASYEENMHKLCTMKTVEEFWGFWNQLAKPSELFLHGKKKFTNRSVSSFSVFKEGIKPEWEDEANAHGGEWSIMKRFNADALDRVWDHLILGLIGESFDPHDEITGARIVLKQRKDQIFVRFEVWLKSRNMDKADAIKVKFLEILREICGSSVVAKDVAYKKHSST